jgi:hypothetical protein
MSLPSRISSVVATLATALVANVALIGDAHAYIDPGTGTMLLQMGGAIIAAGLFYLRTARLWLGRMLGFGRPDPTPTSGPEADSNKQ